MAYIDYKVTGWVRIHIEESQIDGAQAMIRSGNCPDDLIEELEPSDIEYIIDVEEYVPVEENDGQSTIELYSDRMELLYSNDLNSTDYKVKNPTED